VEKDLMTEIEQMSYAIAQSTKEPKEKENVNLIKEAMLYQEIDKMNEGEEEEDLGFVDRLLLSQEDPDKEPTIELMDTDVHMSDVPSHSSSQRAKHLRGMFLRLEYLNAIHQFLKDNHRRVINEELYKETKSIKDEFSSMVSKELVATAPQQIQEFLWNYMQNHAITFQPPTSIPIHVLQEQLYTAMEDNHNDHSDAPPGEKNMKTQKTSKGTKSTKVTSSSINNWQEYKTTSLTQQHDYDGWYEVQEIDDDKVISEEASLEFLAELLNIGDKRTPTIVDLHKMKVTLDDMMEIIDLFYLKNGNTEAKKYVLSLHKIHAISFPEDDLEEHLTRWVGKVFKRKKHIKERSDPSEDFSNQKIVEVIKINNEQGYRQDFTKENVVKRSDVHDYQLGIKSYQIKINQTASTLITNGIDKLEPYTIITDPFIGIVYENIKKEKKGMDIKELSKFYDATLSKVLKKVEEINVEASYGSKDPPLSKEDKEFMKFFEEEIKECLKHRRQMMRWESYVNRIPILPLKDHLE
ncbi:hypothetical protein Tco_0579106, partial [Tanacetum coccineum]